jgi:hypothetical protein
MYNYFLVPTAVQVEQINLNLDLIFIVGLPLPFRINQAKSKGSFITQYLFETGKTPAEPATASHYK